ncbi:MAG: hypothetical protein Q8O04_08850 [Deltaproteobacteria bacterium]|nr:hypothetical protein [Deltaproteobacteria bacterium]
MDRDRKEQRWEIGHTFRLILLIAAIVFFGIGLWMIYSGIKAEGTIDVKSALVSGTVKSGSAGIFITVLSFMLMVLSLPGISRGDKASTERAGFWQNERNRKIAFGFALVAIVIVAFILTKEYFFLGTLAVIVSMLMGYIINS